MILAHTHTHTHARTCMHTHTHTHAHTQAHAHACMHTHTHTHAHTHTHMHTYTHTHALLICTTSQGWNGVERGEWGGERGGGDNTHNHNVIHCGRSHCKNIFMLSLYHENRIQMCIIIMISTLHTHSLVQLTSFVHEMALPRYLRVTSKHVTTFLVSDNHPFLLSQCMCTVFSSSLLPVTSCLIATNAANSFDRFVLHVFLMCIVSIQPGNVEYIHP